MKYRLVVAILIFCILTVSGCARFAYVEKKRGYKSLRLPYVRVKVLSSLEVRISCKGPYDVHCVNADGSITEYHCNAELIATAVNNGIHLAEKSGLPLERQLKRVVAVPADAKDHVSVDNNAYPGVAEVVIEGDSLSAINAVYLEDYLEGVLPAEIGRHSEPEYEALKAQAVASRTYSISRFKFDPAKPYDMVADVADQVYKGLRSNDNLISRALRETKGEVLMSGDELVIAYYHSTCGGETENIEDVWDKGPRPYLKGVEDDTFCQWSKFYHWEYTWTGEQIERSVRTYLRSKGRLPNVDFKLLDLVPVEQLPSGRITLLNVVSSIGEFALNKDQLRWAFMRPDKEGAILPSIKFSLKIDRDSSGAIARVTADGHGNGHGVGMCQCGALGRARAGQKYDQILLTYYRDVRIVKIY